MWVFRNHPLFEFVDSCSKRSFFSRIVCFEMRGTELMYRQHVVTHALIHKVSVSSLVCLSRTPPHQSELPDGAFHWASAGSGSPLHRSGSRSPQDQNPLRRIPACPCDSAGNSSADRLQRGHRRAGRRRRKKKDDTSHQVIHNINHYFTSTMQIQLFCSQIQLLDSCSEQTQNTLMIMH